MSRILHLHLKISYILYAEGERKERRSRCCLGRAQRIRRSKLHPYELLAPIDRLPQTHVYRKLRCTVVKIKETTDYHVVLRSNLQPNCSRHCIGLLQTRAAITIYRGDVLQKDRRSHMLFMPSATYICRSNPQPQFRDATLASPSRSYAHARLRDLL